MWVVVRNEHGEQDRKTWHDETRSSAEEPKTKLISAAKRDVKSKADETISEQGEVCSSGRLILASDKYRQVIRRFWRISTVATSSQQGKKESLESTMKKTLESNKQGAEQKT